MKIHYLGSLLALALISSKALADTDPWVTIGESEDTKYKILAKYPTLKIGDKNISVLVQYLMRNTPSSPYDVSYFNVSMPKKACDDGFGIINFSSISGDPAKSLTAEYVSQGISLSSNVGDRLCNTLKNKRP